MFNVDNNSPPEDLKDVFDYSGLELPVLMLRHRHDRQAKVVKERSTKELEKLMRTVSTVYD